MPRDDSLSEDSGREGVVSAAAFVIGAVPLILFLFVLMLADDYALLREVAAHLTVTTLLIICIPLLPLWIAAAWVLLVYAWTRRPPDAWGRAVAVLLFFGGGLFAWSLRTFAMGAVAAVMVTLYAVVAARRRTGWLSAPLRAWSGARRRLSVVMFLGVVAMVLLAVFLPASAARDLVLRGFPREKVFVHPEVYCEEGCDEKDTEVAAHYAHVLRAGDQYTTVVLQSGKVVQLRNDSVEDRGSCRPERKEYEHSFAAWLRSKMYGDAGGRTPSCNSELKKTRAKPTPTPS